MTANESRKIVDDNFLHALRIYHDTTSGAVRLQASVHKGEMKRSVRRLVQDWEPADVFRSPVWTAFITEHLGTRGWLRVPEPKVVILRSLRLSVFTFPDYNPPLTPHGEHVLKFTTRSGMYPDIGLGYG